MPSATLAAVQNSIVAAIVLLFCLVFVSPGTAEAADFHYEVYSGESVTISINEYGGNTVTFNYPNGFNGSLNLASTANFALIYSPNSGFVGTDMFTYTASSGDSVLGSDTVYIVVKPKITFSASSWSNGKKGESYSQSVTASFNAGSQVVTYSVSGGSLPDGLSLDSTTGTISGTPTASGASTFTYTAENADGYSSSQSMTLRIAPNPSDVAATVAANSSGNSIAFTVSGTEQVSTISPPTHGIASLSGSSASYTPSAGYSGSDSFTYTVTDSLSGLSNSATVSVTVTAPTLSIAPSSLPDGIVGQSYSQSLSATLGGAINRFWVLTGNLPAGLTLSDGGVLSGMPTVEGTSSFTVIAQDIYGATGTKAYNLTIAIAAPVAGSSSATVVANSTGNTIALNLSGGAAASVAVASAPLHGTATAIGTSITYTPTSGYSGVDSFTYTATNATGTSSAATVTITITPPTLVISPSTLPGGVAAEAYSQTLSASAGTGPYNFTVTSGTLPAGLALSPDGTLSGTPTTEENQTFTVTATDAYGATGSQSYTLPIAVAAPVAGDVSATIAANSTGNTIVLNLSGGTASSVTVTSSPSHGTATASGTSITYTPTSGYSGGDSFTYTAANATGTSAAATVTITVSQPILALSPTGRFTLRQNEAFSQAFTAGNGGAPYQYAISGTLPAGIAFDAASATLAGTPAVSGEYPLTLTVADAHGATASAAIVLAIDVALPVAPSISSVVTSGLTTTVDLTDGATGGPFSGADLVSLSPPSAGTATIILGDTAATDSGAAIASAIREGHYRLRFTASPTFSGTVVATYTLTGAGGTSAPATVTFSVSARPDLSADPDLAGLVKAQAEAAKRLADSQIDNVTDHLKSLRGKSCLENSFAMGLADATDGQAPVSASAGCSPIAGGDLAFWTNGSLSLGDADRENGASAFDYATIALTAGLDYRVSDTVLGGIAIGFSRDRTDIGDNGTTSLNKAASATLYGLYQPGGGFFLDGLIGAGLLDFHSLRVTSVTGEEAEASRSGRQFYAAVTSGYDYRIGDVAISSYGRLNGSRSILDGVEESGAGWENALIGRQQADSLTATLGLALGYDIDLGTAVLTPELTLDFSHDFLSTSDTTVTYADRGWPTDYIVPGSDSSRDRLTIGLGLTLAKGNAGTMTGRYSATLDRDGVQSQRFNIDLSREF